MPIGFESKRSKKQFDAPNGATNVDAFLGPNGGPLEELLEINGGNHNWIQRLSVGMLLHED